MRVVLLNAPPRRRMGVLGQMYPPLGLLYLAAYARAKYAASGRDLDIKVIDGYHEKPHELLEKVLEVRPDVLGVSFTTQASTGAYELVRATKGARGGKDIHVVCGGPHTTIMPEEVLACSSADVAVVGEGEAAFHEILEEVERGTGDFSGILGIAYRDGDRVVATGPRRPVDDISSLPFPARDLVDNSQYPGFYYKKEKRDTYLISSRGCPYDCVYCSNPVWKYSKPWLRLRSPENVVDEMEQIVASGITEIYDQTDMFNGSIKWAKALCDEVIRRGLKVSLKAQMRADHIDDELAQKMRAAGFWLALVGVESANPRTLKGIRKKTTPQVNEEALETLKRAGIKTLALLMAFNAWEEDGELCFESVAESHNTLDYVARLAREKKADLFSWSLTTPYPGSELYDLAVRHKLISEDIQGKWEYWDSSERMIMQLPGITQRDWVRTQNRGKKLQAWLLLKSGSFNWKSLPLYLQRAYSQLAKQLRTLRNKKAA